MASLNNTFGAFLWFLYQAVIVGGQGVVFFAVPFVILAAFVLIGFPRKNTYARRRLVGLVISLPAIWVFVGLWGAAFWLDWTNPQVTTNPRWAVFPTIVAPWLTLLVAGFFVWRLKGVRLFALAYSLINMYFVLAMSFLSGMAITGEWL